jgi:hypothetical protein
LGYGLCIGITNNKVDTVNITTMHVVDSIATSAPNAYYFYDGGFFLREIKMDHKNLVCALQFPATAVKNLSS